MKTLRHALLPAFAVVAAAVAGCGGSSSGSEGDLDPASRVPATSPFYAEIVVRPDGDQRRDVEAVAQKVLGTDDPGAEIVKLIDESARKGNEDVTFAEDIDPWLGDRIGIAVMGVSGGGEPNVVAIVASKDDDKARATLAKSKGDYVDREYKGVTYRFDREDEDAQAVVDGAFLAGTEGGVKAAIDAGEGDSLAEADKLESARDKLADERLGLIYADVEGLLRAASNAGAADPQTAALLQAVRGSLPRTLAAGLDVDADAISLDAVSIGTPESASTGASGAEALAGVPASAWLGAGLGELGSSLDKSLDQIASGGGLSGVGVEALLGQVQQATGLDLRRDVLAWMGDAGLFVAGSSVADLHGGLIVQSKDAAATRRTLDKLGPLLSASGADVQPLSAAGVDAGYTIRDQGAPPIYLAVAGDRFVVAVGPKALRAATASGGATLGSSAEFSAAAGKLGGGVQPSFFLSIQQLTALLASEAGGRPEFQQAKRYLDAFGAVVGGAKDEGDGVTRARIVATLR